LLDTTRLNDVALTIQQAFNTKEESYVKKAISQLQGIITSTQSVELQPMKLDQFMAEGSLKVDWLWESIIPRGAMFAIIGELKQGKSEFSYQMASAVAKGESFLELPTQKSGVLILAVEEHPNDVRRRLNRIGASGDLYLLCSVKNSPATISHIENFILKHNISLILVDTLSRFWQADEENNNTAANAELQLLLDLCRRSNVSIGLIHHARKGLGELRHRSRGASAILDILDQILFFDKGYSGVETDREIQILGRYQESPRNLLLKFKDGLYEVKSNKWFNR